jgi:WD40 repeat protein
VSPRRSRRDDRAVAEVAVELLEHAEGQASPWRIYGRLLLAQMILFAVFAVPGLTTLAIGDMEMFMQSGPPVLDGRPVAVTAGHDKTARVWDLATGEELTALTDHTGPVHAVACTSLNGRPVAVTAGILDTVRVWDLATGEQLNTFTGQTNWVRAVACTVLDDHPVAVTTGDDETARVWDLATGDKVAVFDFRGIGAVAFGSGGELIIAAGWDLIVFDRIARH